MFTKKYTRTTISFNAATQERYAALGIKTKFGTQVQQVFNRYLDEMEWKLRNKKKA